MSSPADGSVERGEGDSHRSAVGHKGGVSALLALSQALFKHFSCSSIQRFVAPAGCAA